MPTGPLSTNWELLRKRLAAALPNPPKKTSAAVFEGVAKTSSTNKLKRRRADDPGDDSAAANQPKKSTKARTARPPVKRRATMPENDGGQSSSKPSASLALWAEDNDIPVEDLARAYHLPLNATKLPTTTPEADADLGLAPESGTKTEVGKYIALDCEMVGVGEGDRESSALARVSIVNFHGHCVLDCFVKPKERVTDWRTWVSGVSPKDMVNAITFEEAQQKASELLNGRILVGHAIKNDLECLLIGHPRRDIRDTSRHPAFRKYSNGRTPALKKLANEILGIEIQGGSHSSIEDARACMLLYRRFKDDFERENQIRFPSHTKKSGGKKKRNKK